MGLAASDYGSCFAQGLVAQSVEDDFVPAPGHCVTYLVRPVSTACGPGSLGETSNEIERVNLSPYACP